MVFSRRSSGRPESVAIFSAAFNPPTVAHCAIVDAALARVDEVLIALPRVFPHKSYEGLEFEVRRQMAELAFGSNPRCSVAAVDRGLFIDIAEECRQTYPGARLYVLVGRDAAERIVNWDYGSPDAFARQLEVFELLVAFREGRYEPPGHLRRRVHDLDLPAEVSRVSSSEVRRRIQSGEEWRHLVPAACVPLVENATSSFSL